MNALILLSEWQKSQIEFWRPIREYPNYDASSFGRVRSWYNTHGSRRAKPLMLSQCKDKQGYPLVNLYHRDRVRRSRAVHRLVALAFLPNPINLPCVNHLTGIKDDNRVDGLQWITASGNTSHAWRVGLKKIEKFPPLLERMLEARRKRRLVSDDLVRAMRRIADDGISQMQIVRWTGLRYTGSAVNSR